MKTETVKPDYEKAYNDLQRDMKCKLEEQYNHFKDELDKERNAKNMIIENQCKEIEFYKKIIEGILHIK